VVRPAATFVAVTAASVASGAPPELAASGLVDPEHVHHVLQHRAPRLTGFNNNGDWVGSRSSPTPRNSADLGYSIELRPGRPIRLRLPADLTAAEAGRIARFITALPALADSASATEQDSGPGAGPARR